MYSNEIKLYIDQYLKNLGDSKLKSIIKYSIEDGKCIRGYIVKHILEILSNQIIWEPIVAIELIHASSLIIDDLPCMDNDIERRGKPTTHVKFGERESILSAFYLISESCKILINCIAHNKDKFTNHFDSIIHLINNWCNLLGENLVVGQLIVLNENIN